MSGDFMDIEQDVQEVEVPVEEPKQEEEVSTENDTTASTALTETRVQELIAEATARAVAEAKEAGKRELQSAQDRNKAELARAERRARVAETAITGTRQRMAELDPDAAKELELAEYRAREAGRMTADQEAELERQQTEFHTGFISQQTKFMTDIGVDPKDSRIDWADDAANYLEAMARIQTSVAQIQKENVQTMQSSLEQRLKDLEAKVTAEAIEANSVDTTTSSGVVSASDVEFRRQFADGTLPLTKANIDRHNKLINST